MPSDKHHDRSQVGETSRKSSPRNFDNPISNRRTSFQFFLRDVYVLTCNVRVFNGLLILTGGLLDDY